MRRRCPARASGGSDGWVNGCSPGSRALVELADVVQAARRAGHGAGPRLLDVNDEAPVAAHDARGRRCWVNVRPPAQRAGAGGRRARRAQRGRRRRRRRNNRESRACAGACAPSCPRCSRCSGRSVVPIQELDDDEAGDHRDARPQPQRLEQRAASSSSSRRRGSQCGCGWARRRCSGRRRLGRDSIRVCLRPPGEAEARRMHPHGRVRAPACGVCSQARNVSEVQPKPQHRSRT
jgi:hypothetical protein